MMLTMGLAAARIQCASELALIANFCEERGLLPVPAMTAGQVELARWMLASFDRDGGDEKLSRFLHIVSDDMAVRLLTGEAAPSDALANYIGGATDGAVLPYMFFEPSKDPSAEFLPSAEGRAVDLPEPPGRPPAPSSVTEAYANVAPGLDLLLRPDGFTLVGHDSVFRLRRPVAAALHQQLGAMLGASEGSVR